GKPAERLSPAAQVSRNPIGPSLEQLPCPLLAVVADQLGAILRQPRRERFELEGLQERRRECGGFKSSGHPQSVREQPAILVVGGRVLPEGQQRRRHLPALAQLAGT